MSGRDGTPPVHLTRERGMDGHHPGNDPAMGMPGNDTATWFHPSRPDRETYTTVRQLNGRPDFSGRRRSRDQQAWTVERRPVDRLAVAGASYLPGDRTAQLATDVMAAGRAAVSVAAHGTRHEEGRRAGASLTSGVPLGAHLLTADVVCRRRSTSTAGATLEPFPSS